MKPCKPLVKWSGGKSDEIKLFEKYIPAEYDTYIEPFVRIQYMCGSVFLCLQPEKSVISDVHIDLLDVYNSVNNGHIK